MWVEIVVGGSLVVFSQARACLNSLRMDPPVRAVHRRSVGEYYNDPTLDVDKGCAQVVLSTCASMIKRNGEADSDMDANGPSPFTQDLEVTRYFSKQFRAISEGRVLDLLERFEGKPFMNAEARAVFGGRRQSAWVKLAALADTGLVVKRGHMYRVAPFAIEFVRSSAGMLRHLMLGTRVLAQVDNEVLRVALEGVEALYSKGKLSQDDYFRYRNSLEGIGIGVR
jgi:hypothetical protein